MLGLKLEFLDTPPKGFLITSLPFHYFILELFPPTVFRKILNDVFQPLEPEIPTTHIINKIFHWLPLSLLEFLLFFHPIPRLIFATVFLWTSH